MREMKTRMRKPRNMQWMHKPSLEPYYTVFKPSHIGTCHLTREEKCVVLGVGKPLTSAWP